jgi:membrane-associated phospholipid phosphatase
VGLTHLFFNFQSVLVVIPLVALARVYYRCHWLGDTLGGMLLGVGFSYFAFTIFPRFSELMMYMLPGIITGQLLTVPHSMM